MQRHPNFLKLLIVLHYLVLKFWRDVCPQTRGDLFFNDLINLRCELFLHYRYFNNRLCSWSWLETYLAFLSARWLGSWTNRRGYLLIMLVIRCGAEDRTEKPHFEFRRSPPCVVDLGLVFAGIVCPSLSTLFKHKHPLTNSMISDFAPTSPARWATCILCPCRPSYVAYRIISQRQWTIIQAHVQPAERILHLIEQSSGSHKWIRNCVDGIFCRG